jgi:paraquat-inducible protein B
MEPELPRAAVRRRRFAYFVWVIPVIAALVAGWLVYEREREKGPEITIRFKDGGGLRVGQTPLRYRGVQIGEVSGVDLSPDHEYVEVKARLRRSTAELAREGAMFWVVRPQVGFGNITGLNTVLTGPEIHVLPGQGGESKTFTGLERAPAALGAPGVRVVLKAERPKSLRPNSPVYYRGVEVGLVQEIDLGSNGTSADIHVLVFQRYAGLVRTGSAFWNSSGINVKGGLLKGMEVEFESMRALIAGGIEFASPENSPRARNGATFFLHESPKNEWLAWTPKVPIPRESSSAGSSKR